MLADNPATPAAPYSGYIHDHDRYEGEVMNMRMGTLAGLVTAVALAAGCGSSSATGTNGGGGSATTTVHSAHSAQLGTSVLVNHKGMTLYTLSAEQGGR